MSTLKQIEITEDVANKRFHITREFVAPLERVWKAWTDPDLLDIWWAPKPWKAVTEKMDFREGGSWLYYMEGPEGEKNWCRFDIQQIADLQSFTGTVYFCDEQGKEDKDIPKMYWDDRFYKDEIGTMVEIKISFDSVDDMKTIMEMRFKEGFTAACENLDELLME
ncbi:SRPBCC family protein [Pedobacter sp.]|uniref:SRPBCC family protein n=1 Tax=Pedobacter sp. TaxID=1411316 RepID=UPI003D7F7D3D